MGAFEAILQGVRRALRYWPVWLALWLAALISVIPLALSPAVGLLELARRPVVSELAGGVRVSHILDALQLVNTSMPVTDQPERISQALVWQLVGLALTPLLLPLLGGVVSAFAWGGALLVYHENPQPMRARRFLWGCWHWFGSFLLLALIESLLVLVGGGLLLLSGVLLSRLGQAGTLAALVLALGLVVLLLALFELARVQAVRNDTRNILRMLGMARSAITRRPLALVLYYALALLGLLALHALFRGVVLPGLHLDALLPALVFQQGFVLARLLARAVRLAGLDALLETPDAGADPVTMDLVQIV